MMKQVGNVIGKRARTVVAIISLSCALVFAYSGQSFAVVIQLTSRSLAIGTPVGSANTSHTFNFSFSNSVPVGSMVFQYCTSPLEGVACVTPTGLDVSAVQLHAQTGATGFSILSATTNQIAITRAPTVNASGMAMIQFTNAINPADIGPFYVRISAYPTQDATGPENAYGAVVSSITQGVSITTEVPPILDFCVGITIGTDCSSASDNLIELGYLSDSKASVGTSQMMVGTNAAFGATITATGSTMTSGNNVIPALAVPTASAPGNSQFGINLRKNTDPAVGSDPSGSGVMQPTASYDMPNKFTFKDNDVVAATGGVTDTRKFTVSYVVNISPSQEPGVYSTTITYVCAATF